MWTNVAKPGAQTYTNVNPIGKEQYDQADVAYDSSTTFYDGVNPSQWTDVAKPTFHLGSFTWAQMLMSWAEANTTWGDTGNVWNNVAKPT